MMDVPKVLAAIGCLLFDVFQVVIVVTDEMLSAVLRKVKHRHQPTQSNSPKAPTQPPRGMSKWKCIGASVIGMTHEGKTPCQDSSIYERLVTGELIVAVSDGASSAKHAEIGSQLACKAAVSSLSRALSACNPTKEETWQKIVEEAFQAAFDAIQSQAELQQVAITEYAATLLVMICTPDFIVSGMVGDGAVVILQTDGCLQYLHLPQRGEYVNEAYFITSHSAADKLEIKVLAAQAQAVAMMTDALLRISGNYKKQRPHPGFFSSVFHFICSVTDEKDGSVELAQFLSSERVNQNTDDDKTLVLIIDAQLTEVFVQDESIRSERSEIHVGEGNSQTGRREAIHRTEQSPIVSQALP